MDGITNNYIEDFLRPLTTNFIGVFSSNNLPQNLPKTKTFSLVCNHDKVGEAGSHFITVIHCNYFILYIDSLGLLCTISDIRNFLFSFELPVFYNSRQLQSIDSSFCGFYCILYVLYFDNFLETFVSPSKLFFNSNELSFNDALCINHIVKLVKSL
jgi:hypothetical protein